MAGQEFQYIEDILKEFYAPAIVNQVYKKAPFWAQIQKRDKGMYGKRVVIPIQTAFTEAVGSRVANDYSLPTSQRNTYDQAYITMKRIYGRIQVDGFSIESAKGKGGWVDIVTAETKGVSNAFAIEMDRQSMCDGSGIIGHVASNATPAITVDNPGNIVGDTPAAKWFRAGMLLDAFDVTSSYTELIADNQISSISGAVLTMGSATGSTLADGDYIARANSWSATDASVGDMMGIDGIISTANKPGISDTLFQGINRAAAANEVWRAHVDTTSQVLSENVIQVELDAIDKRTDGETVNLTLTTYDLRNKLIDIIRADRQVTSMDLKGGWTGIKYQGGGVSLPIMVHKFCPVGYMYFISLPHIAFYTLKGLTWDDKGGGVVKPVAGFDAYESWFVKDTSLAIEKSKAENSSNSVKPDEGNTELSLYKQESVETRRGTPIWDEGIVQTTNIIWN